MRCWRNISLCLALTSWPAMLAHAEFKALDVRPKSTGNALELAGEIELGFTDKVEEALNKGIPMEVLIEVRLTRDTGWWWARTLGDWRLRREIRFHALTGQYLVKLSQHRGEIIESHNSQAEALRALGNLADLRFALPVALDPDETHRVRVRASLDIEALPPPLRPVAYTSLAWHLNSGWSQWLVAR